MGVGREGGGAGWGGHEGEGMCGCTKVSHTSSLSTFSYTRL